MTLATITLDRRDTFQMSRTVTGEIVLSFPLEVLKQAYCDYVASQARPAAAQREGVPLDG